MGCKHWDGEGLDEQKVPRSRESEDWTILQSSVL